MSKPFESKGARLIAAERTRQVEEEGNTAEIDDRQIEFELSWAAVCYAAPGEVRWAFTDQFGEKYVKPWPYDSDMDKREKHSRVRRLVIAGALIAAELDRLDRAGEFMPDLPADPGRDETHPEDAAITFPGMVKRELARARRMHANLNSAHEAYAVILEEIEEFKAEVFKKREDRSAEDELDELVQIAAMAQRAAEDLKLLPTYH